MTVAKLLSEHLPSRVVWMAPGFPERGFEQRSQYMRRGFVELGLNVVDSPELTESKRVDYDDAKSCQMFDLHFGERVQRVWYDSGDFPRSYHDVACSGNDVYFKVSLRPDFVRAPRVYPIAQRAYRESFVDIVDELRDLQRHVVESNQYAHDLVAVYSTTEFENRVKAVQLIKSQPWKTLAGISPRRGRAVPADCVTDRWFAYDDYMRMTAKCRLGLSLLGTSGDTSCRRVENMGMGLCGLVPEDGPMQPGPWTDAVATFRNDFSDFIDVVDLWLADDATEGREDLARNGIQYWEDYASPRGQASYILRVLAGLEDPWIGVNATCG